MAKAVLALSLVASLVASVHAEVVSSIVVEPGRITITVPVAIVGANPAQLSEWKQAIDRAWNRGNVGRPFTRCGREIVINPVFTPKDESHPSPTSHLVVVQPVPPGQLFVSSVWHALGTSPSYSPRTGIWGSNMDARTSAHEFGHLLGLLDEYLENDVNANGLREPGERPVPDVRRHPDAWYSLMATERGIVLPRHIDEVVRMHGGASLVSCEAR